MFVCLSLKLIVLNMPKTDFFRYQSRKSVPVARAHCIYNMGEYISISRECHTQEIIILSDHLFVPTYLVPRDLGTISMY